MDEIFQTFLYAFQMLFTYIFIPHGKFHMQLKIERETHMKTILDVSMKTT